MHQIPNDLRHSLYDSRTFIWLNGLAVHGYSQCPYRGKVSYQFVNDFQDNILTSPVHVFRIDLVCKNSYIGEQGLCSTIWRRHFRELLFFGHGD